MIYLLTIIAGLSLGITISLYRQKRREQAEWVNISARLRAKYLAVSKEIRSKSHDSRSGTKKTPEKFSNTEMVSTGFGVEETKRRISRMKGEQWSGESLKGGSRT
jgi:hypothetical protein